MTNNHVTPVGRYVLIWALLLVFTGATTAIAYFDLGSFNIYVAMTIAIIKAVLVILFFMHVKEATRVTKIYVGTTFFWLAIMLALTLTDYMSRGWLGPDRGW